MDSIIRRLLKQVMEAQRSCLNCMGCDEREESFLQEGISKGLMMAVDLLMEEDKEGLR
jgi:hypothetical protein